MHHHHNKQYGLRWADFTSYIEEYALGRKLTKPELKRFVEKNILTIGPRGHQDPLTTNQSNG